ncbi:hypothetical protein JVU11DRAFT_2371 [Chiua virens]|nr:hypothetical protein JVU11DRAFT_2371 [Chiua virens]
MSFADATSDSLRPILLRSSTPGIYLTAMFFLRALTPLLSQLPTRKVYFSSFTLATPFDPSPKVLLYLEGLRESQSIGSPNSSGFPNLPLPSSKLSALEHDQEFNDVDSNVQDGRKTELSVGARSGVHREPSRHDPPGPHYESFDSGPSFGNFGPLPDHAPHNGGPPWGNAWESQVNGTAFTGVRVPLPTSVASPVTVPLQINVEPPSTPSGSKSQTRSQSSAAQYKSQKSVVSVAESESRDTVTARRQTKAPTARSPPPDVTPMSPSRRSRAGSKSQSQSRDVTDYPPLPPSTMLSPSGRTSQLLTSPRSRHRAPSISPSDSPSQAPYKAMRKALEENERLRSVVSAAQMNDEAIASKRGSSTISPVACMSPSHQSRPFSPYRHAPTNEDLLFAASAAAARTQKAASQVGSQVASQVHSQVHSQVNGGGSKLSHVSRHTHGTHHTQTTQRTHQTQRSHQSRSQAPSDEDGAATPTQRRSPSPSFSLNAAEEELVAQALAACGAGDRTSYAPSTLEPEIVNSHFHDMDLCILLHQMDDLSTHEVVKKALRKAVRQRVKKLGMKYDVESIKQYRKSFHDHDPSVHLDGDWEPTIPSFNASIPARSQQSYAESTDSRQQYRGGDTEYTEGDEQYGQTPRTQTVNINTQATGTMAESMYQANETEIVDEEYTTAENSTHRFEARTVTETREFLNADRDDSPGQQFLEEELYKLRVKPGGSQSAVTHKTWEVARDDQEGYEEGHGAFTESGLPEIPDSGNYTERRVPSPPLPPIPQEGNRRDVVPSQNSQLWNSGQESNDMTPPPWQRIHQRLLNWAIIWPMSEIDTALTSTTRGQQVDEVALSIWSTQTYKRYVRSRMTDVPGGKVDRLFVPPNMADAISTAVFNGRHGDACGMLRELWAPFGFEGAPRLIVVLAKHRSDANHWVVHRFSLPDGTLTTYDSYPERTLPDGRPLGWWFAIRVAWPGAIYANPDHLMQKMVRLHRPMQLNIDNSVAAAGIWRNVLMGSRAERSLDLERLRDLINTEVKNLRQRKLQGKLSISSPKPHYEDM